METFNIENKLTASDIDCHGYLRISSLLNYLQNIATEHGELLDVGGAALREAYDAFWMVARFSLTLTRPIYFGEALEIRTWPRSLGKGATVFRDYEILAGGTPVGQATSSWVVVSLAERRILKPSTIEALLRAPSPEQVYTNVPQKVQLPPEMQQVMRRPVVYSDTDINGHINNTKYIDVACDALGFAGMEGKFISALTVNYLKESFVGEELTILMGEREGLRFVSGTDDDGVPKFAIEMQCLDVES